MNSTTPDLHAGFRDAMAHLCAPVSVITAMDGDRPHGTTVSALMSLSAQPQLIAVSVAQTSDCLALIRRTGMFGVNILRSDQREVAMRFATKGAHKFDSVAWRSRTAVPLLDDTAVWLACRVAEVVTGGDHEVLFGEVCDLEVNTQSQPLTYHARRFGTHLAHTAA